MLLLLLLLLLSRFSCVRLFVTPWTAAHQAPLSMGFSGKDTGVVCHFLFQGIFLTQGDQTWVSGSAGDSLLTEQPGKSHMSLYLNINK